MNRFNVALRLLWRDFRSGELTVLFLALLIAVTSATAISLFADRLHKTMSQRAADFLAADLVVTSPTPLPEHWLKEAAKRHLQQARTAEFSSVLIENDELLLAGIKAVSPKYPLRGELKTIVNDYEQEKMHQQGPEPGQAWVEKRVLSALHLQIGDSLTVGEKAFVISRMLTYEPDKRGDLYSLSPRVMINEADLAATRVLQPGSHVHYFFQFGGREDDLISFNRWVKPHLNPSQRLLDIYEDRPELGDALKRAERYLGLSSIVVVVIAGVAIAMATGRYTERHFNATAILRCLGLKQNEVLSLYLYQFIALGLVANTLAIILGWLAQEGLFFWLRNLFPAQVAEPGLFAVMFGYLTGLAILFGFALPPLLRLKNVSPLRVLRRDLAPYPISAWLVYGLATLLIFTLVWRYSGDLIMTLIIIGGGLMLCGVLGGAVFSLLKSVRYCSSWLSPEWRFGLQHLIRNRRSATTQILAFTITLVALILTLTVRNDVLTDWQKQLPENAPNHFALNIFADQIAQMRQFLQQQQISDSRFYPIVRGRLVAVNDVPVQRIVSKESVAERATHRDLSLTWGETIPDENRIVAGQWWTDFKPGSVSVEAKLAENLGVKLGDKLTFTIGSEQVSAVISSIRKVKWDTMKPNFYMFFSPGTLQKFPTTYLTSFYLPSEKKPLLNDLAKQFPAITLLEVDQILDQFKSIVVQLSQALTYLLYAALLAGFMVLFAAIYATLDQRIYEGALMRTLGARKTLLRKSQFLEFAVLGFIAAASAIFLSAVLLWSVYHFVLELDFRPNFILWMLIVFVGSLFVALAGLWGVRNVIRHPPLRVFREH